MTNGAKRPLPYLVVFVANMGVMIIELAASRLVAKYFGTSLFTWTGVIGVVLGGISLGNFLGGRLADRRDPVRITAPVLLLTSLLVLLIFLTDLGLNALIQSGRVSFVSLNAVLRSVALIFVLFFLPATSFGLISPVMAKYALVRDVRVGRTVGGIYAAGAVGSIVGTFLAGFVLIPLLGIKSIIFLVAASLAAMALLVEGCRLFPALLLAAILALYLLSPQGATRPDALYTTDSQYSHITVAESTRAGRTERVLIMDGLIHNRIEPGNPDNLLYEYERIFAALTRHAAARLGPARGLRTLTLGAGGLTFPTYLERHYPQASNRVVEVDPQVIRVARSFFEVAADSRLDLVIADARVHVSETAGSREYDLVYLDAFNSYAVPAHLTTLEFTRAAASLLADGGLLIVNVVDILPEGRFLASYLRTLDEVFPSVAVYAPLAFDEGSRSTFVLAAGRGAAPPDLLADSGGQPIGRALERGRLEALKARSGVVLLTDDHAPVDNLMAPVFLRSVR